MAFGLVDSEGVLPTRTETENPLSSSCNKKGQDRSIDRCHASTNAPVDEEQKWMTIFLCQKRRKERRKKKLMMQVSELATNYRNRNVLELLLDEWMDGWTDGEELLML
jgi:hypothetical protein